ncbi:hypothetical protein TSO221_04255 [Azospirillum sp. TSO22-1]|nr:hypothetical protein TSO221_04255 [Azospirillum sp. TSO22-1]
MCAGLLAVALAAANPVVAAAQAVNAQAVPTYRTIPLLTDSEAAGVGCGIGMAVAGAATAYFMGGAALAGGAAGRILPIHVLEIGAATAFLLSSACYVGQVMTPFGTLMYNSLTVSEEPGS